MSAEAAFIAALAIASGVMLAFVHFGTLGLVVDRFSEGRMLAAASLQGARLLMLGAVMVFAAWLGALPLLACLAGLLVGRWLVLRRARRAL